MLVLGASASGADIAIDISGKAAKVIRVVQSTNRESLLVLYITQSQHSYSSCHLQVYLSHSNHPLVDLPETVEQVSEAVDAFATGFKLRDGTAVEVDAAIFCTVRLESNRWITTILW